MPDQLEGGPGRAFYVQDGGYPDTINWMMEAGDQPAALSRAVQFVKRLVRIWLRKGGSSDIGADLSRLIGRDPISSTTLPLFSMGRDIPDGTMRLTDDALLEVDWDKRQSNPTFEAVRRTGRDIARVLDGTFADNPPWYVGRVVTVHPLGVPDGRGPNRGCRRRPWKGVRLPGLRDRRRLGDAGPGRAEPLEHDRRSRASLRRPADPGGVTSSRTRHACQEEPP